MGVALPILLVLALAVTLLPARTPTAEAAVGQLRFERVPLPQVGSGGDYVIAPLTDCGPIAVAPGGSVLYGTANITDVAAISTLLKSSNGGNTWKVQGDFRSKATTATDNTSIVAIKLSPEYLTDNTVFVATQKNVFQSPDGGTTFYLMASPPWNAADTITDMDIALDDDGRISIIVGVTGTMATTDVFVYTGLGWKPQNVGNAKANYNVLAVAFSPNFAADEGIVAVTINGTDTQIQFAFGYIDTGGGWGASIGPGRFLGESSTDLITAERARIAFPDDFDVDSTLANNLFVGVTDGTAGSATEKGDVYKITAQPSASTVEDLNVRGLIGLERTKTNIWSLEVTGPADDATILAGTDYWSTGVANYYWSAYISNDSGASWSAAREKSPTGGTTGEGTPAAGVATEVLLSPAFTTDGTAWAATKGSTTSAISRTKNGGASWNQISLIDWASSTGYAITAQSAALLDNNDQMVLLTANSQGAVFHTKNAGGTWERVFSYANPNIPATINAVYRLTDVQTVFIVDKSSGKIWRSSDAGATFPRLITARAGSITAYRFVNADTIWTGHSGGAIWFTEHAGRPWWKPDESDIGAYPLMFTSTGDKILVGEMASAQIHMSLDGGKTFKRLGVNNPTGTIGLCGFDPNYATNKFVYSSGTGVYRIEVNEDDIQSTEWKRIDNVTGASGISPNVLLYLGSILYAVDSANVSATSGGLWRCTNPAADLDGPNPPAWNTVNTGLNTNDKMSYSGLGVAPYTFFLKNSNPAVAYYNMLLAYSDILSTAVTLSAPANAAKDQGILLSTTDLTQTVILSWAEKAGVTRYQLQVATDSEFMSKVYDYTGTSGNTPGPQGTSQSVAALMPGMTYYWRVRAEAPILTPWSEGRSFTVSTVAKVPFDLSSPTRGAIDVDTMPVFVWTEYAGAIGYEIMVSEDPTFAIIDWSRSTPAGQTMYKSEEALAYDTTYYWRVRGVTGPAPARQAAPGGPWATGIFTTMAKPVEEKPIVIVEKEPAPPPEVKVVEVPVPGPAQAIPDYLLWIVIIIGAVLIIALIVLIVRTRRVA